MSEDRVHQFHIEFCSPCNYLGIAIDIANHILGGWGPIVKSVELQPSGWGVLEITMDGELIFSKMALSRLLKPGELEAILTERIGPPYENYLDHVPEVADERGMPTVGPMMAMKKNAEREAKYKAEAQAQNQA